ncbi:MAG: outer membrane protein assembly factor BamB family protein [Planctomycetota bacterium]|jgi:outer membrane protein assembly factor BamB
MSEKIISGVMTGLFAAFGAVGLGWWVSLPPDPSPALRIPIVHSGAGSPEAGLPVDLEGRFETFEGKPSKRAGTWPGFRGPERDNVSRDPTPLSTSWGPDGPPVVWSLDLGEGHAGAAVGNGRVYVLDYDEGAKADALRCFSLDTGHEIWRRSYRVRVKRNHGMSRTVPAVNDRFVVTLGPKCHVICADAVTGEFKWGIDLVLEYGSTVPLWYTAQCPLIDENTAVLAPAGSSLMIGVDLASGKVLWKTPNPRGWRMSHSSIMKMKLLGRNVYVYCALGGIAGVSADDADRGELIFESEAWKPSVVAPSPVWLGDEKILITSGYGAGSLLLEARKGPGGIVLAPVLPLDKKAFACEQHTPIFHDGRLYTVLPNDAGPLRRQLVCMDTEGNPIWNSGKTRRFGLGPFVIADDKIFVLSDDGSLTAAKAGSPGFELLARAKILSGRDAWAPIALVQGRMILRDWKRMVCLDLRAKKE